MHFPNVSLGLGAKAFQSVFSFGVVETMGREANILIFLSKAFMLIKEWVLLCVQNQ
jgi:hypothetical protein